MNEQKGGEIPFLVHDPTVHPAGLTQVSALFCKKMKEWVTSKAADPFALESQHVPSVVCWCSPKTLANNSPSKTQKWEISPT